MKNLPTEKDPHNRYVVTGMDVATVFGQREEFWSGIKENKNGVISTPPKIQAFNTTSDIYAYAPIEWDVDEKIEKTLGRKEVRRLHRSGMLSAIATQGALDQAGLLGENGIELNDRVPREKVGFSIGSGISGTSLMAAIKEAIHKGQGISPQLLLQTLPEVVVTSNGIKAGAQGPTNSLIAACATGTANINNGIKTLISDPNIDIVVSGGVEGVVDEVTLGMFRRTGALNLGIDGPEYVPRPFDKAQDGFVMGDGACDRTEPVGHVRGTLNEFPSVAGRQLLAQVRDGLLAHRRLAQVLEGSKGNRCKSLLGGKVLRRRPFENISLLADRDLAIIAVGQVDELRGYLRG